MRTIRTRVCAVMLALATTAAALVVTVAAAPAQAGWSDVGGVTRYSICRTPTPSGRGWIFHSRVRTRAGTGEGRAGIELHRDGTLRRHWTSRWLEAGQTARQARQVRRSPTVRIHVWQEAGDRDSDLGTALQQTVHRTRDIRRC